MHPSLPASLPATEGLINIHGPFEAKTRSGASIAVLGLAIGEKGYLPDVIVRLAKPYVGQLFDDEMFVANVNQILLKRGYIGPALDRAESGMQGEDFIVLEPNRAFAAFAMSLGWKDLGRLEQGWATQGRETSPVEVEMQQVTYVFKLRTGDQALAADPDSKHYSAYMFAVEQMLRNDVRKIPGWVVTDTDEVEHDTYQVCDPEGAYSGDGERDNGPYEYFEVELPIQAQRAWTDGEIRRNAVVLHETLNTTMAKFCLVATLKEVRSFCRLQHTERAVLFKADLGN